MYSRVFKSVAMGLIPKIISDTYDYFFAPAVPQKKKQPYASGAYRKKHDTTKFTQKMFDVIMAEHTYWINSGNKTRSGIVCMNQAEFCDHLNSVLRLKKSRAAYARIFNGHTLRDTLPTGITE